MTIAFLPSRLKLGTSTSIGSSREWASWETGIAMAVVMGVDRFPSHVSWTPGSANRCSWLGQTLQVALHRLEKKGGAQELFIEWLITSSQILKKARGSQTAAGCAPDFESDEGGGGSVASSIVMGTSSESRCDRCATYALGITSNHRSALFWNSRSCASDWSLKVSNIL